VKQYDAMEKLRQKELEYTKANHGLMQAENEAAYSHVWKGGQTGISSFKFTMPDHDKAEELIGQLLSKAIIADAHIFDTEVHKSFLADGTERTNEYVRVTGVTSDSNAEELSKAINEFLRVANFTPDQDLVLTSIATGSKEYIAWARQQTSSSKRQNKEFRDLKQELEDLDQS
jgi:uncharacterized protein involved in tolerance to divalent cations